MQPQDVNRMVDRDFRLQGHFGEGLDLPMMGSLICVCRFGPCL